MRQTVERLDQLYGTEELEVYRRTVRGYFNQFPRTLTYFHNLTCLECGLAVTKPTYDVEVISRPTTGLPRPEKRRVQSWGYFLYFRPRGSGNILPQEVRFVHAYCLEKRHQADSESLTQGGRSVPQVEEVGTQ